MRHLLFLTKVRIRKKRFVFAVLSRVPLNIFQKMYLNKLHNAS